VNKLGSIGHARYWKDGENGENSISRFCPGISEWWLNMD